MERIFGTCWWCCERSYGSRVLPTLTYTRNLIYGILLALGEDVASSPNLDCFHLHFQAQLAAFQPHSFLLFLLSFFSTLQVVTFG